MASTDKIGSLEAEALKRKDRLKALKRKNESTFYSDGPPNKEGKTTENLPKPRFRSYKPQDENLQEQVVPEAKPGNVEEEVKSHLEAANARVVIEDLDITNLAPRKPDWDLKRDVAKKLEKLERRTQKAIGELIRERLRSEQGSIDLATSVAVGAAASLKEGFED